MWARWNLYGDLGWQVHIPNACEIGRVVRTRRHHLWGKMEKGKRLQGSMDVFQKTRHASTDPSPARQHAKTKKQKGSAGYLFTLFSVYRFMFTPCSYHRHAFARWVESITCQLTDRHNGFHNTVGGGRWVWAWQTYKERMQCVANNNACVQIEEFMELALHMYSHTCIYIYIYI